MTPQEQQLVDELFDRLAQVENMPRDPEAERLIGQSLSRAPHALYALTQTALIQDEALKRANARIEDLQAQLDGPAAPDARQGSFLDSMREAVLGPRAGARGSVPSVPAGAPQAGYAPQEQPSDYPPPMPPGYAGGPPFGGGGSFLGGAASTAAGVIGGALMLNAIRSMFGQHGGGYAPSGLGHFAGDRTARQPARARCRDRSHRRSQQGTATINHRPLTARWKMSTTRTLPTTIPMTMIGIRPTTAAMTTTPDRWRGRAADDLRLRTVT